jgi:hypothetical protein
MRGRRQLAVLATLMALTFGCEDDGDNYLKGSVTKSYDMGFDMTRVRLYESELSIEYVDERRAGEQVAARVTLEVTGDPLATGVAYDLAERGDVSRGQGYGSPLPALQSGEITLSDYSGEDGSRVAGRFNAVFATADGTTQTLRGGFSAELEVVSW